MILKFNAWVEKYGLAELEELEEANMNGFEGEIENEKTLEDLYEEYVSGYEDIAYEDWKEEQRCYN